MSHLPGFDFDKAVASERTPEFNEAYARMLSKGSPLFTTHCDLLFRRIIDDPWCQVENIPAYYADSPLAPSEPRELPPAPATTEVEPTEDKLPEVTVTEGGKDLPLMGQLLLPPQRQGSALELIPAAQLVSKEN